MCNSNVQRIRRALCLRILTVFLISAIGFGSIAKSTAQTEHLYWLNLQTGDAVVWYMNGIQWSGGFDYLAHSIPLAWRIFGTDLNTGGASGTIQ